MNGLRYLQRMVVYHVNVEAPYSLAQPHTEIHSITGWTPPQKEFSFSKPFVFCEAPNALKTVIYLPQIHLAIIVAIEESQKQAASEDMFLPCALVVVIWSGNRSAINMVWETMMEWDLNATCNG